jgi:hypothetical protein
VSSCQNLNEPQATSLRAQAPDFSSSVKVYLQAGQNAPSYIGEFDRGSCIEQTPSRWAFFVNSSLGDSRFDVNLEPYLKNAEPIAARVWNQNFLVNLPKPLQHLPAAQLCNKARGEASITLNVQSAETDEILSPIQLIAPDCRLVTKEGEKGLSCILKNHSLSELTNSLENSKRNVSTKWNHQPYLLIRRLTLAQQFISAIESDRSIRDTRRFCRIASQSLPNELPLSFQSKLWQDKVCGQAALDREMALLGLELAVREIESLSKRIEEASHIGVFTLALPPNPNAAKDYWITLQPVNDPLLTAENTPLSTPCSWHPLFATRLDQQLIASELASATPQSAVSCPKTGEMLESKKLADTYIRSSIASEMEFEISNRQSKKLRLPTGDYQYTITQYNGLAFDETSTAQALIPLATGSISWKKAQPHTIIRNW